MDTPQDIAEHVLAAFAARRQIALLTDDVPGFDLAAAGAVAVEVMRRREARGERVAGHKLGFTNRTIWAEYGVYAPIWGPVYETTVRPLDGSVPLAPFLEPRIEPEIVFRLSRAPEPDMDAAALLSCVSHVALGFEIVQSLFAGWRFRAADTVAALALHGGLFHGPFVAIGAAERGDWARGLAAFGATLFRDGEIADEGRSGNVLGGGPVVALAHLAELVGTLSGAPPVAAGQVFTTGTLTRALPVLPGETWEARLEGVPLGPLRIAFA
jgi:2-oxo-3-hexenedioate decarboxylase